MGIKERFEKEGLSSEKSRLELEDTLFKLPADVCSRARYNMKDTYLLRTFTS